MNIIFFNPDQLRAASVGCYGHPTVQTPNLDRLAAEGTRFAQCHVQNPICAPSRCSIMTGWYPHVRGKRGLWHVLEAHEPNLLRYVKQSGHQVHWWGKNDLLCPDAFPDSVTTAQGLNSAAYGPKVYNDDHRLAHSFLRPPYEDPLEAHTDHRRVQAAIDFIQQKPSQPYFLYLPLIFPHPPYSAPQPWHDSVKVDDIPPLLPTDLANRPSHIAEMRRLRRLDQLGDADFREVNRVYLGMIAYTDHLLGRLLDALDESGQADNTAVFVYSDHGDYAGDFGMVEKYVAGLEDVITRIPLVARIPGGAKGHTVQEPVAAMDLMATVLELLNIEAEHDHFSVSLVPQLKGASGDVTRAVFCEGGFREDETWVGYGPPEQREIFDNPINDYWASFKLYSDCPHSRGRCVMMRTNDHKLVYRPTDRSELYDVHNDPDERINLYDTPDYRDTQNQLTERLLAWMLQTSDVSPLGYHPRQTRTWPESQPNTTP